MYDKNTDFPQYRKLSNEKVFYRIRSEREFDEIQLMGSKAFWFSMTAEKFPEILRIQDLLNISEESILHSSEAEFTSLKELHCLG